MPVICVFDLTPCESDIRCWTTLFLQSRLVCWTADFAESDVSLSCCATNVVLCPSVCDISNFDSTGGFPGRRFRDEHALPVVFFARDCTCFLCRKAFAKRGHR